MGTLRQSHHRLTLAGIVAAACMVAAASVGPVAAEPPPPSTPPSPTTTTTTSPPPPSQPGGSVQWSPAGRVAVGQPLLYLGSSGAASMAWMPPKLLRAAVFPGTIDPGPWPVVGQVDDANRPFLVAAFNGGFDPPDFTGTITAFGHAFRDPAPGVASFVAFADGSFTVGIWGRDINPSPNVIAIRQNLSMLVDGGVPTPEADAPGRWGASVAGVATMRSGLGVDAHGGLVWAGGRLSPAALAAALIAGGAVRGMQLDINPDWVNFNLYQPGADGVVHGSPVYGATGPDRYLSPNSRDFIAVLVRGTVIGTGPQRIGLGPLDTKVRVL